MNLVTTSIITYLALSTQLDNEPVCILLSSEPNTYILPTIENIRITMPYNSDMKKSTKRLTSMWTLTLGMDANTTAFSGASSTCMVVHVRDTCSAYQLLAIEIQLYA